MSPGKVPAASQHRHFSSEQLPSLRVLLGGEIQRHARRLHCLGGVGVDGTLLVAHVDGVQLTCREFVRCGLRCGMSLDEIGEHLLAAFAIGKERP